MTRGLTTATKDAFLDDRIRLLILFKAEFDSGDTLLWNGIGDLDWSGDTYSGSGDLGRISEIVETTQLRAAGITCELSGVPSALNSIALTEFPRGRPLTIRVGAFDLSTRAIIADPFPVFVGRMDVLSIRKGPEESTITISAENELVVLERASERRYTTADQAIDYPGDTFFKFVPTLNDGREVTWGP